MKYTPNPTPVVEEMLKTIGVQSLDDLFSDIKEELKIKEGLGLPAGLGEIDLSRRLKELAGKNISTEDSPCFLGAGAYDHYIPAALDQLLLRSEFLYCLYTLSARIKSGNPAIHF